MTATPESALGGRLEQRGAAGDSNIILEEMVYYQLSEIGNS